MTATERLTGALLALLHRGLRPPCAPPAPDWWLSEDHDERALAALACSGCPVLAVCAEAADEQRERFGVWAGIDRGRRTHE